MGEVAVSDQMGEAGMEKECGKVGKVGKIQKWGNDRKVVYVECERSERASLFVREEYILDILTTSKHITQCFT